MSNKAFYPRFLSFSKPAGSAYATREYLDGRYFLLTIIATLFLHLIALYVWHLVPQTQVVDIPVMALNIKLGDGDEMTQAEIKAAQPDADNKNDVESAISKMVQSPEAEAQAHIKPDSTVVKGQDKELADPSMVQEAGHKLASAVKQFIRPNAVQASSKGGSTVGNSSAKEAEMMSRYEQLISLWIEKFKLYPPEARAQGMQGETVVRIRIDRQGNIVYYILERSTGLPLLDRAAIDMIKRANPVPAVPNDYPKADLIEFLIPVNFHLQ